VGAYPACPGYGQATYRRATFTPAQAASYNPADTGGIDGVGGSGAYAAMNDDAAGLDTFAVARNRMVDSQIRPNRVNDLRIVAAMRELPRELFVPDSARPLAYADRPVAVAPGRWLMEPRITARLLQVSEPRAGERALVIAAGAGYTAMLLCKLGVSVTALEFDAGLAGRCEALALRLAAGLPGELTVVRGSLPGGWKQGAPYDLILIDGGVRQLPDGLAAQLAEDGRLATVLVPQDGVGTAVLAEASTQGLRARAQFDANTPPIPEFSPAPGFRF